MPQLSDNLPSLVPPDWVRLMPLEPLVSSEALGWRSLAAYRFKYPAKFALDLPPTRGHFISAHLNNPCRLTARWNGVVRNSRSIPGDIIILGAKQRVAWDWIGEFDELQMFVDPVRLQSAAAEISDRPFSLIEGISIRDPFVSTIASRLIEEMVHPGGGTTCFSDVMAEALIWHLLRRHSTLRQASTMDRIDMPAYKVRAALEFMMTHLAEDISVDQMAAAVNMSPFRFARGFKKAAGQSPYQYMLGKRIERAQDLLRLPGKRLADIAVAAGFATQSQFTAAFRRHCQMTPGQYRGLSGAE